MPNGPHLVRMSEADFADIPSKVVPRTVRLKDPAFESPEAVDWIFIGYCGKLLTKNEGLKPVFEQFSGKFDDSECLSHFTRGQRVLHSLAALNGQVTNGGITQFFWNCPDLIFEVSEALEALGDKGLLQAYDKAVECLIANKEEWIELRKRSGSDSSNFWESFQESYDLLDLDWFDDAYFKTYGPALVARLVEYVKQHKTEFIES